MNMRQRPECFTLDYNNKLANNLVCAGLGSGFGTSQYIDSSMGGNNGVFTNMNPIQTWKWSSYLNRFSIDMTGDYKHILFAPPQPMVFPKFTISMWVYDTRNVWSNQVLFMLESTNNARHVRFRTQEAGTNQKFLFYCFWQSIISDNPYTINHWHHLCVTSDGAILKAFVDATQQSGTISATPFSVFDRRMMIGYDGTADFVGSCSDFLFYNRVLSLKEIEIIADPFNPMYSGMIKNPKRKYHVIKYHPTTARLLMLKQNNRFLSLQKI